MYKTHSMTNKLAQSPTAAVCCIWWAGTLGGASFSNKARHGGLRCTPTSTCTCTHFKQTLYLYIKYISSFLLKKGKTAPPCLCLTPPRHHWSLVIACRINCLTKKYKLQIISEWCCKRLGNLIISKDINVLVGKIVPDIKWNSMNKCRQPA